MKPVKKKPDGRIQRSERSRQLIIDSMQELVHEGNLVPTAQQVAERAQVGIRTVFRHFNDMESLFKTMEVALRETYQRPFRGGNREGSLEERILHAMECHADAYETVRPIVESTRVQMWRFDILRENYARNQRELRKDLENWLPEIRQLPALDQELVEATASYEYWNRLREQQGLSKKKAIAAVTLMLTRIFRQD
jgi:AcrR family transcriptional regulator